MKRKDFTGDWKRFSPGLKRADSDSIGGRRGRGLSDSLCEMADAGRVVVFFVGPSFILWAKVNNSSIAEFAPLGTTATLLAWYEDRVGVGGAGGFVVVIVRCEMISLFTNWQIVCIIVCSVHIWFSIFCWKSNWFRMTIANCSFNVWISCLFCARRTH